MTADKKRLYILSGLLLAALLLMLFAPAGSGRIIAAIFLLPGAAACWFLLKKRNILSMHKGPVLVIITVIGLLYVMSYYITALFFGFTKTGYGLRLSVILDLTLPVGIIIVATELIRFVLCAQNGKLAKVFCYFICLIADVLICNTIPGITSFSWFMEIVALVLLPSILSNLLYNYLTVRYGFLPNMVFRLLTVWVFYLIPYGSAISDSLLSMLNLFLPVLIYLFIDALYERKRRYALGNPSRFRRIMSKILTIVVVVIMLGTVMLVSNHFYYGAYVVATDSMTGELNKGDVAIYERYEDQPLIEGQVVVYKQGSIKVIHRIVDIKIINGIARYYTKGDVNENMDTGYRIDGDIIGLVNVKLPYFGYPTLWLRSLFKR